MRILKVDYGMSGLDDPISSLTYKLACVYSEDSNQSAHLHSLIIVILSFTRNVGP